MKRNILFYRLVILLSMIFVFLLADKVTAQTTCNSWQSGTNACVTGCGWHNAAIKDYCVATGTGCCVVNGVLCGTVSCSYTLGGCYTDSGVGPLGCKEIDIDMDGIMDSCAETGNATVECGGSGPGTCGGADQASCGGTCPYPSKCTWKGDTSPGNECACRGGGGGTDPNAMEFTGTVWMDSDDDGDRDVAVVGQGLLCNSTDIDCSENDPITSSYSCSEQLSGCCGTNGSGTCGNRRRKYNWSITQYCGAGCNSCTTLNGINVVAGSNTVSYPENCDSNNGGKPWYSVDAHSGKITLSLPAGYKITGTFFPGLGADDCGYNPGDQTVYCSALGTYNQVDWIIAPDTSFSCEIDPTDSVNIPVGSYASISTQVIPSASSEKVTYTMPGGTACFSFSSTSSLLSITKTIPPDSSNSVNVYSLCPGSVDITVSGSVSNDDWVTSTNCAVKSGASSTIPVTTGNPASWYQVSGGDAVAAGGPISSQIVGSCLLPSCEALFDIGDSATFPSGLTIYTGSINPSSPNIAGTNVDADPNADISSFDGDVSNKYLPFDYDYFESRALIKGIDLNLPNSNFDDPSSVAGLMAKINANIVANKHTVIRYAGSGPLNIGSISNPSPIDFGWAKLIILADSDVEINRKLIFDNGRGFLMVIASGNITINSAVGGIASPEYDLEGIYLSNNKIFTADNTVGTHDTLRVRGSFVGLGNGGVNNGIEFLRNLTNNGAEPAEFFEYAPDVLMNFPEFFGEKPISTIYEVNP